LSKSPFICEVFDVEIKDFHHCVITWEDLFRGNVFAQYAVERLNGVGGIDDGIALVKGCHHLVLVNLDSEGMKGRSLGVQGRRTRQTGKNMGFLGCVINRGEGNLVSQGFGAWREII
jgi:hypothetical protein